MDLMAGSLWWALHYWLLLMGLADKRRRSAMSACWSYAYGADLTRRKMAVHPAPYVTRVIAPKYSI